MPYKTGVDKIKNWFISNGVTNATLNHSYNVQASATPLMVQVSFPGYKFPNFSHDYRARFFYNGGYISISHSDIALDIIQKCIDNPSLINDMKQFVYDIGLNGDAVPVPSSLASITINPPNPIAINHVIGNTQEHRVNQLPFGIPIDHYPSLLYWVSLNEEVNYHPTKNTNFGGRKTAFKRYLEAVYFAEECINNNWINNSAINSNHLNNLVLLIDRIKRGRCNILNNFPLPYRNLFMQMDTNYQH